MKIHTIGIDLGKTKFHVVGLNERGEVVVRKQLSRAQLLRFTANRKVHLPQTGSLVFGLLAIIRPLLHVG